MTIPTGYYDERHRKDDWDYGMKRIQSELDFELAKEIAARSSVVDIYVGEFKNVPLYKCQRCSTQHMALHCPHCVHDDYKALRFLTKK